MEGNTGAEKYCSVSARSLAGPVPLRPSYPMQASLEFEVERKSHVGSKACDPTAICQLLLVASCICMRIVENNTGHCNDDICGRIPVQLSALFLRP